MLNAELALASVFGGFDFIDFSNQSTVLLAVSGGGDSTALLVFFCDYVRCHDLPLKIVAATVDHGLRPESADEAVQVARLCRNMNVEHETLVWRGSKPTTGVQSAARAMRYQLLSEAAQTHGAKMVLTGHTLSDQIETLFMRAKRKSGRGMSGIAQATLYRSTIWFVRPLLGVTGDALRTDLQARDIDWLDDPSNTNDVFERVRVRKVVSANLAQSLLLAQKPASQQRAEHALAAAEIIADRNLIALYPDQDAASISMHCCDATGFETSLSILLCWCGQKEHFPADAQLKKALDFIAVGPLKRKLTVHGCLLKRGEAGISIEREHRNDARQNFCFDYLLNNIDYPVAQALNFRLDSRFLPKPPIKSATR